MNDEGTTRAWLGLGGNLGDPANAMSAALRALDDHEAIEVVAVSSLYRTPPWGMTDQPDFLNAVAAVDTRLSARRLLDLCLKVEADLKRVRAGRWGPRVIDIDLLSFGEETIDEPGLQVPHPRMAERAFVLVPLAEIAPDMRIGGESVEALLARLDAGGIARLADGRDWWQRAG